jgi:transcriptional regulator with XRE-family HTH domain
VIDVEQDHGMISSDGTVPFEWGLEVRRARLRSEWTQADLADVAGTSRSMVCRMELGLGGGYPLTTWLAVADAVGVALEAIPRQPPLHPFGVEELVRLAEYGGWIRVEDRGGPIAGAMEVILERPPTGHREFGRPALETGSLVTVLVADVVTDLARLGAVVAARTADLADVAPDGWQVSGGLVVRATAATRRRVRRGARRAGLLDPATASRWIAALTRRDVMPPPRPALMWMARDGRRLTPPWLHLRTPRVA